MKKILAALLILLPAVAQAQIVGTLPFQLQNGTTADATQVMADFNKILNDVNANAAKNGINTDITALDQSTVVAANGTIAATSMGFRGAPQNAQTASYGLVLADNGKHISITTGGVTVPSNAAAAFPIGATVVIYNNSGASQTIAITTDTMRQAGTTNTGSRTLANYGLATLLKTASTEWVISGAGLS